MKKTITIVLLLISNQSYAVWSGFAAVTPEMQDKYNVKIESSVTSDGSCKIKFNAIGYPSKHAWLILTSNQPSLKEQELRSYIWNRSDAPSHLVLKSKINPQVKELVTMENIKKAYYEVTLTNQITHRAYIYIDFPTLVFDGGYYYSVDIGSYCGW